MTDKVPVYRETPLLQYGLADPRSTSEDIVWLEVDEETAERWRRVDKEFTGIQSEITMAVLRAELGLREAIDGTQRPDGGGS